MFLLNGYLMTSTAVHVKQLFLKETLEIFVAYYRIMVLFDSELVKYLSNTGSLKIQPKTIFCRFCNKIDAKANEYSRIFKDSVRLEQLTSLNEKVPKKA